MVARNGQISPIGIDLGSSHVKLSQLRRAGRGAEGRWRVSRMAEQEATLRCDGDFLEQNRDIYASIIRSIRSDHGFRGREATLLLPGNEIDIRSIRVPAAPPDGLAHHVAAELESSLNIPAAELVFDYWAAGHVEQTGDTRLELVAVSIKKHRVRTYLDILGRAGLRTVAVDVSPCALARTLVAGRDASEGTVAVLDIGKSATLMGVVQQGNVVFGRSIGLSREDLEAAGAEPIVPAQPPMPAPEATTAKAPRKKKTTRKKTTRKKTAGKKAVAVELEIPAAQVPILPSVPPVVVRPPSALDRLVSEVSRCLSYLRSLPHIGLVSRIVLFGGGASMPGFAGALRGRLDLPVEVGLVLEDEMNEPVEPATTAVFGSSIGVALWGLQEVSNG